MPRPVVFAVAFTLIGTCWSFGQDAKNDSKPDNPAGFEGKEAGDRKELVPGIFFRWCPAGKFMMGSPETELGFNNKRSDNEEQVSVTLTNGFWLGETEVTQGQWLKFMGTMPWAGKAYVKEGDNYAASYIKSDDAAECVKKLTTDERASGRLPQRWKYSLPTEAQWEYACRAGTTTKYSFGDDESGLSEYGWWGGLSGDGNAKTEQYVHEVGQKKANPWGLKDMHGNVYEWCADWYGGKLQGGRNPEGPSSGLYRVDRGGSWYDVGFSCRSASRYSYSPGRRGMSLGFRLAAVPE